MKRVIGLLGVLLMVPAMTAGSRAAGPPHGTVSAIDAARIEGLLNELKVTEVESLPALPVAPFVLPTASVDVMRVRVSETYQVYGIGTDTVHLTGWIAVTHDNPRPARGEANVAWGTAVADTEFVGLQLTGESAIFGPVQVTLDPTKPSRGQVGKLSIPFMDQVAMDLAYREFRRPVLEAPTVNARANGAGFDETGMMQPERMTATQQQVATTLRSMWNAIEKKSAPDMLKYYSKAAGTVFFNDTYPSLAATNAGDYVKALSRMFENIDSIKVVPNNDMRVKVAGNLAFVTVTGKNEVVDREKKRGSGDWRYTVELTREGSAWLITHDHLSFFVDANRPVDLRGRLGACGAQLSARVDMPKLDLHMATKYPVQWYSEVTTIPPVGHEASVSAIPTPLVSAGREVAVLRSGAVTFREIVRHVALDGTSPAAAQR
jgi:ketosteroid isomerase-like protein